MFCFLFSTGIRKHALDKPFSSTTGIDPDKKKGSKRSRRRAGFESREKDKQDKALALIQSEQFNELVEMPSSEP
jgi:hypothetical protein